ncbi:MAG TPA: hypothetical protein IGS53_00330 [Leptolyngbyaceae cyanobacterium M33_DOE_097]|uniref:STAS domain-containing protein n=1 Tax=Oscillatoriales cyanobacterium SpSt-418 TaxID=2282169 RepID=A0A7C3KEV0_9CYAN|nr:hypothetical protein [Leptolyngbyaceae cyanobacterium M33_DOE_097]
MTLTIDRGAIASGMGDPLFEPPVTLVLQPTGELNQSTSSGFQTQLEAAIAQAQEAVIVDLIWVEQVDRHGICALINGLVKANTLGKILSIQSMSNPVRVAFEQEWTRQQELNCGGWDVQFEQGLELFLSHHLAA